MFERSAQAQRLEWGHRQLMLDVVSDVEAYPTERGRDGHIGAGRHDA